MSNNFGVIASEYKEELAFEKKKTLREFLLFAFISGLFMVPFGILYDRAVVYLVFFYIALGLCAGALLLLGLIMINFSSEKTLYTNLYPKVIEVINSSSESNISYESFPKNKEYIKKGALFRSSWVSIINRYQMTLRSRKGYPTSIYDLHIESGDSKHRQIHFDGIYFIMELDNSTIFQIRSKGRANLSSQKMLKLKSRNDLKDYVSDQGSGFIDSKYYALYDSLKSKFPTFDVFISGFFGEIHVAIWGLNTDRKIHINEISSEEIIKLKQEIIALISLSEEIVNIIR